MDQRKYVDLVILLETLFVAGCGVGSETQHMGPRTDGRPSINVIGDDMTEDMVEIHMEVQVGWRSVAVNGERIPDFIDGVLVPPGDPFDSLLVVLPMKELSAGKTLLWRELPSYAHLLARVDMGVPAVGCDVSKAINHEGDPICGARWMTFVLVAGTADTDLAIDVEAAELRPGGRVALSLKMTTWRLWDFGSSYECGGYFGRRFNGILDKDLALPIDALKPDPDVHTSWQCPTEEPTRN